ncbi:unnamed protein product [Lepeophtheirus salmonis]|uniref:(salmon louse) hypothetical protein n=1 Tax=Lepeophtheirus salmonis TaxID=72036 RepID=A0A7R8CWH5_LEPSM|nr:uncharacterized protein LOC121118594 [Lepeophtheirus salmonis]CAB4065156.1 unnamed protein product [Lepeophtheirus salmonis]CAF2953085.1 unnamed protein product [Lepeophtheirus salmonis]
MPVFGNRMVISTGSYKHVKEVKKETERRESSLGEWAMEKQARMERLKELQHQIRKGSVDSTGNNSSQHYDLLTGDSPREQYRRASMSVVKDDIIRTENEDSSSIDRSRSLGSLNKNDKLYFSSSACSSPEHMQYSDTHHIVECSSSDKGRSCDQCCLS